MVQGGEIVLSGYVVADADAMFYGEMGGYFTPKMVRDALSGMTGTVTVRISSDGGDPFAGEAIRSALAQHPGGVDMVVEGLAASAASLIFMAGMTRRMSRGSLLMIHDPAMLAIGNEADMLKTADTLGKIADTYAAVYGAAAGMTTEAARKVMRAETWFSADAALEAGFATEVMPEAVIPDQAAMTMEAAKASFRQMQLGMAAMVARKNSDAQAPGQSAAAGGQPAIMAISQESVMDNLTPAAVPAATPVPVAPVAMAVSAEAILMAERARVSEIRMMSRPFVASGALAEAEVDEVVDAGVPASEAGQKFLTKMSAAQAPIARGSIVRDEVDTRRVGMTEALTAQFLHRNPTDDRANAYMGMTIAEMSGRSGGYLGSLRSAGDRINAMMAGVHTTGDYTGIFENALNKALLDRYQVHLPTYRKIARKKSFNDFRVHPMVRAGDFPNLLPVGVGGEIKFGTFGEKRETAILSPYGVGINFERQMFLNDDTGAISDLINDYGSRVAVFEEATFYAFLASATLSSDGLAVWLAAATRGFTAAGNLVSTGTVISIAALGIGQAAMRKQTGIDGAKLNLTPKYLLVGPDKEIEAKQFVTQITPALGGSVNPFSGQLEVIVSAEVTGNNWYLFAEPNLPGGQCFVYGYLNGAEAPRLRTDQPFGIQGWSMTLEHDFGLGAVDFRGTFKNVGA